MKRRTVWRCSECGCHPRGSSCRERNAVGFLIAMLADGLRTERRWQQKCADDVGDLARRVAQAGGRDAWPERGGKPRHA